MNTRKSIYAGSWYPGDKEACREEIVTFLNEGDFKKNQHRRPVAGIVPHAGWFFSGSVACNVIAELFQAEPSPDVAVVFGMHLSPRAAPHIMAEGTWETPFGNLAIAEDLARALLPQFDFVIETHKHFMSDNTIELQLPFIRYFSDRVKILPVGVPPSALSLDIAQAIVNEAASLGLTLTIIGSTDLTHYGPNYGFTPHGTGAEALSWVKDTNDAAIIRKMLDMHPEAVIQEALMKQNACCGGAAASAIAAGKALGASKGNLTAYLTSHDKSPGQSYVGYAGLVFTR